MNTEQFTGHTPGPWHVVPEDQNSNRLPYIVAKTGRYGPNILAGVPGSGTAFCIGDESACAANAALIAAAPELLKQRDALLSALQGLMVCVTRTRHNPSGVTLYAISDTRIEKAQKAIALCETENV